MAKQKSGKSTAGQAGPAEHSREERLTMVFHALGDPNRRQIIDLLRESPALKVGNIAAAFDMSLNGVSKHIKVLERAGLLVRHVEGRDHFLSAKWPTLELVAEWVDFYRNFWASRLDNLADEFKQEE